MSTAAFDTSDVAAALPDITNGGGPQGVNREENLKHARGLGWVEPQNYNYEAKVPTAKTNGANQEDEEDVEDIQKPSTWAHDANKYEWKEEYGEVGPRSEALEKELFRGDFINRAGEKLKK
jgi:ATP-dependent RNA helicase DDX3X